MSGLKLGMFREALKEKDDMPSFLGDYFNTFWAFLRTSPVLFKAEIKYTPPCPGCLRCFKEPVPTNQNQSWFSKLFRARKSKFEIEFYKMSGLRYHQQLL